MTRLFVLIRVKREQDQVFAAQLLMVTLAWLAFCRAEGDHRDPRAGGGDGHAVALVFTNKGHTLARIEYHVRPRIADAALDEVLAFIRNFTNLNAHNLASGKTGDDQPGWEDNLVLHRAVRAQGQLHAPALGCLVVVLVLLSGAARAPVVESQPLPLHHFQRHAKIRKPLQRDGPPKKGGVT